jgi:hypothetical protein
VHSRTQTAAETLGRLEVNHLVRINIAGSATYGTGEAAEDVRSRVEDVVERCTEHGRRYLIAAPRYTGDVEPPASGTPCTLEWPGPHGIWILPVTFVNEGQIREGLRVWLVEVLAPARQTERRSFVRVDWELPLAIEPLAVGDPRLMMPSSDGRATLASADAPPILHGHTLNISEGGIRCLLPAPALACGVGVVVKVEIAGEPFDLPARVQWVRPTGGHGPDEFDTAVAFDDPGRYGDRLRPLLFAEQLRIRRAGLA